MIMTAAITVLEVCRKRSGADGWFRDIRSNKRAREIGQTCIFTGPRSTYAEQLQNARCTCSDRNTNAICRLCWIVPEILDSNLQDLRSGKNVRERGNSQVHGVHKSIRRSKDKYACGTPGSAAEVDEQRPSTDGGRRSCMLRVIGCWPTELHPQREAHVAQSSGSGKRATVKDLKQMLFRRLQCNGFSRNWFCQR